MGRMNSFLEPRSFLKWKIINGVFGGWLNFYDTQPGLHFCSEVGLNVGWAVMPTFLTRTLSTKLLPTPHVLISYRRVGSVGHYCPTYDYNLRLVRTDRRPFYLSGWACLTNEKQQAFFIWPINAPSNPAAPETKYGPD